MKRILLLLTIGVLLFSISACGYADRHTLDKQSQILAFSLISEDEQLEIKNNFVLYLKKLYPDNADINELTTNDILLMEQFYADGVGRGLVIDWYGNKHEQGITKMETGGEPIQIYADLKEISYYYDGDCFTPIEEAFVTGLLVDDGGIKNTVRKWKDTYEEGQLFVYFAIDADIEDYIDADLDEVSDRLGITVLNRTVGWKDTDGEFMDGTKRYWVIDVPQRGKRELYELIHMLSRHSDIQEASLNGKLMLEDPV